MRRSVTAMTDLVGSEPARSATRGREYRLGGTDDGGKRGRAGPKTRRSRVDPGWDRPAPAGQGGGDSVPEGEQAAVRQGGADDGRGLLEGEHVHLERPRVGRPAEHVHGTEYETRGP